MIRKIIIVPAYRAVTESSVRKSMYSIWQSMWQKVSVQKKLETLLGDSVGWSVVPTKMVAGVPSPVRVPTQVVGSIPSLGVHGK